MIYVDNAATTQVNKKVLREMFPFLTHNYGNPSSIHSKGRLARQAVEIARGKVAKAINAKDDEIYFTGSGTEADNWAIRGVAKRYESKGKHIITSSVEHHAVLNTCRDLESMGYDITYLPVDKYGAISLKDLKSSIKEDTVLASIMFVNNEIGTIMPIKEIGKICRKKGVLFHTDAVQAIGMVDIDVNDLNIDLLSMSAHKFHGTKGAGALYIRDGVDISPFITGGSQERGKRAATENVPGIVGMGKAIELATENIEDKTKMIRLVRNCCRSVITELVDDVKINGSLFINGHPGILNVSFKNVESEQIIIQLDLKGICASSGSACTSGDLEPSHVLSAIGVPDDYIGSTVRLSFNENNTIEEAEYIAKTLKEIVDSLRATSTIK